MKRMYSQEEKEKALALCSESGSYRASKQLGIPQSTLAHWMKISGVCTNNHEKTQAATEARDARIAAKRSGVKEKLINLTDETLDRMASPTTIYVGGGKGSPAIPVQLDRPPAGVSKDLALTLAILIDKFRLESGESTSRSEVQVDDTEDARAALAQQFSRIADRRGASGDTGEPDPSTVPSA